MNDKASRTATLAESCVAALHAEDGDVVACAAALEAACTF